jgi:hypothetical protein
MATQVQFRRGTTTQNNAFTGGEGELSISTTDYHLRVHDGTTQGGISLALADLSNVSIDTDGVSEGSSNLYYTNARVDAEIDSYLSAGTGISVASGTISLDFGDFDTDNISEGASNLFYTDARVQSAITGGTGISNTAGTLAVDFTEFDTDNLEEGSSNLFYTDARAQAALTGGTGITITGGTIAVDSTIATETYVNAAVANVIDSAPGALDTLNELAAALGDDANFSTTITNSLAEKAPIASPTLTGTVTLPADTSIGTVSSTELGHLQGVTSGIQTQLDTLDTTKAPIASPTFTGTATLPADTSIGTVSSTELGYVDGVTSAIQTQIDTKAPIASPGLTGVPTAPTAAEGTDTTQIATTAFVQAAIADLQARQYAVDPT